MDGSRKFAYLLALVLFFGGVVPGSATTLTVDTGKSLELQPGGTGLFTFSATNDAGAISEDFLGWTMGFQVLPSGVTSGSLTVGELFNAATNPAVLGVEVEITQPNQIFVLANSGTINGSTGFRSMTINSLDTLATLQGSTSYNLGDLTFTASPDAAGTWNVYAVQQADPFAKTYWTDAALADGQFGNLPQSGGNSSVLVGTISVNAVPEPSSLMLAASAIVASGWFGWRSRRQPAVVEA